MPQRIGVLVIDVVTGLYAHQAAATALYRRATRGGGRHVTVSLMDAIGAVQAGKIVEYHLEGEHGQPGGVPVGDLRDGRRLHDDQRAPGAALDRALPGCSGSPELAARSALRDGAARLAHEAELMPLLRERVKARSMRDLEAALTAGDVLHAPVNDYRALPRRRSRRRHRRHRLGRAFAGGTDPSPPDPGAPAAGPGLAGGAQPGHRRAHARRC